jgi:hypothetical protein
VRAAAAEAEERCRETAANVKRVDSTLKRILDDAGSVESIRTRLDVVEAQARLAPLCTTLFTVFCSQNIFD